jgi:hypothetical protein
MNETDIAEGLERYIVEGLPERTVLLENRDYIPERPYITVEVAPTSRTNRTVDAEPRATVSRGRVYLSVVAETGNFAKPARQIADEILALLPYGLRISLTGATILITKPADMLQGYRDGPDWRQPIVVEYEVELP